MTAKRQPYQHREEFEIKLLSEADRKLAGIMFQEREGLSTLFATSFGVQFTGADESGIYCLGSRDNESKAKRAFAELVGAMTAGQYVSKELIKKISGQINPPQDSLAAEFSAANQNSRKSGKNGTSYAFTPKNESQQKLAGLIGDNDLTFALGPAGTGKTHVAIAMAVQALKEGKVKKILLARPAMEAGEKIGFLPGGQNEKLAPYMRPLYDELEKAFGPQYKRMLDNEIEVVPVGFMRGRTFESAFIILDEAQNTTVEQMKMALTRIGDGSKMVVTGDPDQIDLPRKEDSGLVYAIGRLQGIEGVGTLTFSHSEIVRSRIVSLITNALTAEEPKNPAPAAPKAPGR